VRALALSWPETYEDAPWGHPVFKVADNRMFVTMTEVDAALRMSLKLTPEEREIALELPHVQIAAYVGRYGWVTVTVTDEATLEDALEWMRESYWLRAPARLRPAVEGE
jgi:predicted DNA-binding protein (MmcQ/YjbR family)